MIKKINLRDYHYELPLDRIAKFPLKDRSDAKLLLYQNGLIQHHKFKSIASYIPENSLMVFNDTRVIHARLVSHKHTGAQIEVFLLEPVNGQPMEAEMSVKGKTVWKCMIGNAKKWKMHSDLVIEFGAGHQLTLTRIASIQVQLSWPDEFSLAEVIDQTGKVPLPPYIDREPEEKDKERYQTVYSHFEGAVAAPTAGLHFTKNEMAHLRKKGIDQEFTTLHVSAGTFQPIKVDDVTQHPMHREQIVITKVLVEKLMMQKEVIAVGTTSMRTLESIYWYGVLLMSGKRDFFISQQIPYQSQSIPSVMEALKEVYQQFILNNNDKLIGFTEIFILPGYEFRICKGLVTNFHMPGSTLMLLVAAFIGADWEKVYQTALDNDYRFLSYGDGSLLLLS